MITNTPVLNVSHTPGNYITHYIFGVFASLNFIQTHKDDLLVDILIKITNRKLLMPRLLSVSHEISILNRTIETPVSLIFYLILSANKHKTYKPGKSRRLIKTTNKQLSRKRYFRLTTSINPTTIELTKHVIIISLN